MTIAFIAESAGVSVPTVSKVLNGRSGVSDETRTRVDELLKRYGYHKPSAKGNNIIELVFRSLTGAGTIDVIRGVEEVSRRHRVAVVISEAGSQDAVSFSVDDMAERRPRCALAMGQLSDVEREQLTARGIPFVVLDPVTELPDGVPFVGATDWRGGQTATRHLTGLGHRRIALIGGQGQANYDARVAGFRSAMESAGIPVDPDLIVNAPATREDGYAAACSLLARPDRPTAIFATSDMQALGVYRAARESSLRIPEDLSVVGFDDLPVGAWVDPPLTTVRRPLAEMAAAAAEMALALGRSERPPRNGVEMATTLTVRDSTAPPRAAV